MTIQIKRVYEEPGSCDGFRVLIDRLWPRGLTKQRAAVDLWAKNLAPSTTLRKWFGHEPDRFEEFTRRYLEELAENSDAAGEILDAAKAGDITLVYAAKDTVHNHAPIMRDWLTHQI